MKRVLLLVAVAALSFLAASRATSASTHLSSHAALSLHRLWLRSISPNADSSPAYLPHVRLPNGQSRAVVYVLAGNNNSNCNPSDPVRRATTYAFDAASGALLWSRSTTGPSRCTTAGPVADPSGAWVYAPGLDGKVHRYNAATGAEITGHGWPETITLMPDVEKMAANATIGNGHLYVTTSGFIGDQGHYQGHLVSIDLATGRSYVFNSLCSNIGRLLGPTSGQPNYCPAEQSGLFGRGQAAIDPSSHDVYIVSGNGPWNGRTNWGDSVLKIDPSGQHLLDSFTPTNQQALDNGDLDLGSTGPAILPPITQGKHTYHLLVQGGKGPACDSCSGVALRLLNRDDLSGRHAPGHLGGDLQDLQAPGGCEVLTAPAVWTSPSRQIWVFYVNDCGTGAYRVSVPSRGPIRLQQVWLIHQGGTTPIVSHGVLYVASGGSLTAYNPVNHAVLAQPGIGSTHWQYPLVAGHRLFIADQSGHLVVLSL